MVSRSLAFVGILAITGAVGISPAIGQEDATQTSQGLVVKNHMSDAERDRLMQEAMADARRRLNEEKAKEKAATDKAAAEQKKREASDSQAETEAVAAEKKAEEERLAKQLAEQEKASSSGSAMELKPLVTEDLEKSKAAAAAENEREAAEKKSAAAKASESAKKAVAETSKKEAEPKKAESKQSVETKKVTASTNAKAGGGEKKPSDLDKVKAEEKTVIETVSTKQPGSGLSVKTSMPLGDEQRKAEQRAAASGRIDRAMPDAPGANSESGSGSSVSGRVVGMMRSSGDAPRILVQGEDGRMVQVVMEREDEMPAPGALVSVRGRSIGGAGSRAVISATSVDIKSGTSMRAAAEVERQEIAPMAPMVPALPPPMARMPPPMPMGPGPMMMPPPPPF